MNQDELEGYYAVKDSVGWMELSARGKIRVTGPDRVSFLHAMVSNDVESLRDYEGVYSTLLTPTGKIIADFFVFRFPSFLLIDIESELAPILIQKLDEYVIMDDVELEDCSTGFAHFSVQGPHAEEFLSSLFEDPLPATNLTLKPMNLGTESAWVLRKNEISEVGFEVMIPEGEVSVFESALVSAGKAVEEVSARSYNVLRLEHGIPLLGIDMNTKNNLIEAGIRNAYSLEKGCFVGQEVVARATHIGGVARKLALIRFEERSAPRADGSLSPEPSGQSVGRITSSVFSPAQNCAIGFAFVKSAYSDPGQVLYADVDGANSRGVIVEAFL